MLSGSKIYRTVALVIATVNVIEEFIGFVLTLKRGDLFNSLKDFLSFAFFALLSIQTFVSSVTLYLKDFRKRVVTPDGVKFPRQSIFFVILCAAFPILILLITYLAQYEAYEDYVINKLIGFNETEYEGHWGYVAAKTFLHYEMLLVPQTTFLINFVNVTFMCHEYLELKERLMELRDAIGRKLTANDSQLVQSDVDWMKRDMSICYGKFSTFASNYSGTFLVIFVGLELGVCFPIFKFAMQGEFADLGWYFVAELSFSASVILAIAQASQEARVIKEDILLALTLAIQSGNNDRTMTTRLAKIKTCFQGVRVGLERGGLGTVDRSTILSLSSNVFATAIILYQLTI